jgi:hypothetical protein
MRTAAMLRRARIQVRERGILNCRQWFSLGRNLQAAGQ